MANKEYCFNCNEETAYLVRTEVLNTKMEGVSFSYEALIPYCSKCGNEVSVPEVNDLNIIRAYKAHKEILDRS